MAIGPFTVNAERDRVIDFSAPYIEDGVGLIMKRPGSDPSKTTKIFQPFHYTVWLMTSAMVLVGKIHQC